MSIAGDLIRGHTDAIILARLLRSDSYGYEINKTISTLSGGRFELKEATLYTSFKRLEETGCITSYWGGSGPGARRRYYSITQTGRETCARLYRSGGKPGKLWTIFCMWRKKHERAADSICVPAFQRDGKL